ncbi:hypothetical protein ACFQ5M_11420 [Agrilactobacillus yilanensis]|uniref:Uncharacterized protein n=1 Tax=Agrilactobacillus yilanensis TaxID=2485997 RepID=A0ABW4JAR3_9LACO|nr:hypothetical protein [Agrilactobacillus yilanensis]
MDYDVSSPKFVFGAKNIKTHEGYMITFLDIPNIFAKGVTYEETVYYSYRVLSNFLTPLIGKTESIDKYTFHRVADMDLTDDSFYSLILATPDLDPHKMETSFILPQTTADHVGQEADALSKLINYQNIF